MSTRSLTRVHNGYLNSPALVSIYQQCDGYFDGVGKDLQTFLNGFTIVNGISLGTPAKAANGIGCLAAQLVKHLKTGIGGTYLTFPTNEQEYVYDIYVESKKLCLTGQGGSKKKKFKIKSVIKSDLF